MLVGEPVEVAQKTLKEMNLKFSIDEIASDDIPAGQVISQTPVGGASVKEQRIIHLTVSKGGAVILVPDLKGLTLDQAKERLGKLDLALGAVENGSDQSQPAEIIISQSPQSFSKVAKGTLVNIVINLRQPVNVPNLVGMTLADAKNALDSVHLTLGTISSSDGITADDSAVVLAQNPTGGVSTNESSVNLTIGKKEKTQKKTGSVNITIPKNGNSRHVVIYIIDDNGKSVSYDQQVKPGSTVNQSVSGIGNVKVQVLIDGNIVQDREL